MTIQIYDNQGKRLAVLTGMSEVPRIGDDVGRDNTGDEDFEGKVDSVCWNCDAGNELQIVSIALE